MKRILFVTVMASFCFTISCASKKKVIESDVVTVEKPIEAIKEVPNTAETKLDENQYTCLVAGDQRTVVLNKENSKCTVDYTKSGDTKEVAWGKATPSICSDAFDKIRTNIENAGFKCGMSFEEIKKEANPTENAKLEVEKETKSN